MADPARPAWFLMYRPSATSGQIEVGRFETFVSGLAELQRRLDFASSGTNNVAVHAGVNSVQKTANGCEIEVRLPSGGGEYKLVSFR